MPYIRPQDRETLDAKMAPLMSFIENHGTNAGELNYMMTMLAKQYVKAKGLNYRTLNEVLGVFTAAMQEFYRRMVAPYEDLKRAENGDVY